MVASRTRREEIVALLRRGRCGFEQLRRELGVPIHVLEEDLHHVARTVRASHGRLRVEPASCVQCGFRFRREAYRPPGRCPLCKGRRITDPQLWIDDLG